MSSDIPANRPLVEVVLAALRALSSEIDRLDEVAAERFMVNRTDLRCLELLSAAGALAPTALAAALGFTTGGVTTVIDRLERAGYASRRPDPRDRRKIIVEATDLLAAREGEIFGELLRASQALVASYSDAELETIRDFLDRSRAMIGAQANAPGDGKDRLDGTR
jgi:DNA-binding MarR family transcriptional regulator